MITCVGRSVIKDHSKLSNLDYASSGHTGFQPAGAYLIAVVADSPLSGSGTSGSHLSISKSDATHDGYLSSTDWNTFNNKGDEKVKYDSNDSSSGYLSDKVVAGTGISLSEGTGGDADKLKITNSAPDQTVSLSNGTVIS